MKLSVRGEYALRALILLGSNVEKGVIRIQVISETQNIPKRFLEQILNELKSVGFRKKHWYIKARIVTEMEYMLEALRILIEPGFIPLAVTDEDEDQEDRPDRYIPSAVKIGVWRRDGGKCVECGSKERLEYDHVVPISKGGSSTERNVQLLCEKCNRKKASAIQ